jgi:hypothetical protein
MQAGKVVDFMKEFNFAALPAGFLHDGLFPKDLPVENQKVRL